VVHYALLPARRPLQMKWVIFLDQRFNYQARQAVNALFSRQTFAPRGKNPCILNSKRRSRAAFKNMAVVVLNYLEREMAIRSSAPAKKSPERFE
jgi:hypothetical protein